jgi:Tat protein translocase TatC
MSFLDHLEELRVRIFRAAAALLAGCVAGWFLVDRLHLVAVLKAPIAPYLPDGKLVVLSPTEPLMIVLKLAVILGVLLASPIIIWQVWGFLSPALYARERRIVVPALFVGVGLFLVGASLAFLFVVPQALSVLFSFQTDSLATMITFEKYFDFIVQLMVAMGISFELPLVIIILSSFGMVSPAGLSRFRRVAVVLALVGGAALSPGTDVFSMLMLSIPMILLYEVGYLGSLVIWRRKLRSSAATGAVLLALLCGATSSLEGQVIPPPARPATPTPVVPAPTGADTIRPKPGTPVDSAAARRLGLPTGPSRQFPANDSVLDALLIRPGYESTRFRADSATLFVQEKRIDLEGGAMTERAGSILEAKHIGYAESSCVLDARGDPKVFDQGTVLVGEGLRYNTCERRAVVSEALTSFQEGGVEWFMRGDLSQDSTARRIYASHSELTSCDLPVPHYHFQARQTKWISKTVLVARPAVLYVRDVPILWLPFIFQDGRPGRRSGILVPSFGINDIVRPSSSYSRQVTNVGYFWAPNDYFDATARFDWYASRYYRWGLGAQYRWIDRALEGNVGLDRMVEDRGSTSLGLDWTHRQQFSLSTTLALSMHYLTSTAIRQRNTLDQSYNTRNIKSSANYTRRFPWGNLTLGGDRQQDLNDGSISQTFPSASFTPNPIAIGTALTWSPNFAFTQVRTLDKPGEQLKFVGGAGLDSSARKVDTRTTNLNIGTPLVIAGFTWGNSVSLNDFYTDQRIVESEKVPDLSTPDPNDSLTVSRTTEGDFRTGIDWNTGITLPTLFRGSWKLSPGLGITNATSGPFMLRNRRTGGEFVTQTKRAALTLSSNPALFALFPGFGPIDAIRHSLNPTITWGYSPETSIPEEYARAIAAPGRAPEFTAPATQTASFGLSQTFEAKARRAANDTGAVSNARKFKLLSLQTSAIAFDFEQAKRRGFTGWRTQTLSNSAESDLVPGLRATLTHDLWDGPAGLVGTNFDPFLTGVSGRFSVTASTFRGIGRLLGLGADSADRARSAEPPPTSAAVQAASRPGFGDFGDNDQVQRRGRSPFQASVDFSLTRVRPDTSVTQPDRVSVTFSTGFSPTAFWSVTWATHYNVTDGRFESHQVYLERDLHEWRASFRFEQNVNGNFGVLFNIALLDLPDLKFDYKQTTLLH